MKQIDKIKQMNAEELAKKIVQISPLMIRCKFCLYTYKGNKCTTEAMQTVDERFCINGIKMWLESEVEE